MNRLLRLIAYWLSAAPFLAASACAPAGTEPEFTADSKPASIHTREIIEELRESLPFMDDRDFEEQRRGFLAAPDYSEITADAGHIAWSMRKYGFLLESNDFDSIHPSLQRQALLNMNYGLYEVIPGVYQVRGFDLANITFIRGDTGWIVFDTLTAKETARAALELINQELGKRPVVAVVYSHSHADHFGGVRGVVDEEDVLNGKVQIIAPVGFMENAIAENVYAGNAMSRRLFYQYGVLVPAGPRGHVDQSIGKSVAAGNLGLIAPTRIIEKPVEELLIDGIRMVFHNTPGTEAPAEMNTWFPELKAFWAAENITGTIHNIYTLRGALIRDSLAWSKYINDALYRFGQEAEVMFASHNWPRWGNERIQEVMRGQRDMYAHLNNQTLHLANQGVTINEIHNEYTVPESQQRNWFSRGYHGSFEHNSRGVLNRYLGYWDANPATLIPLSPSDSAPLYVEMMGGSDAIIEKGKALFDAGKYRHAQEIVTKLVYAEPQNRQAKYLLADIFEQIAYQQESPSVRNSFLGAALELRHGIPEGAPPKTLGPDLVKAMTTDRFLDYLGIRMDARKSEGLAFKINFVTPDNGEEHVLELSNSALSNIAGYRAEDADLTITVNRADLDSFIMGQSSFAQLVQSGKAKLDGDPEVFAQLQSMLGNFDGKFAIMPGTD